MDKANGGGKIREDNLPALARNGKPSKAYKDSLHPATREDIERLVKGVLEAIIRNQGYIQLKTSYLFKWPDGMPQGKLLRKEGRDDIRVIAADKLLEWLNEKGHTSVTLDTIRGLRIKTAKAITAIETEI